MAKPILLYNSIYPDVAERITNQILETSDGEALDLWINSPGGSVSAGWSILGALKDREVNMNVMGDAASMAFIMLLFADTAEALETSKFMIHRASTWWEEDLSEEQKKDLISRNKLIRTKMENKINQDEFTKITGKTFDDIFSMDGVLDVWMDAKQAKRIGLINKVNKLDVKALAKVEANYYNEIMAISKPIEKSTHTNTNINNNMGIFSKDPLLLAEIDGKQIAYSKLEAKAEVKPIGGDTEAISGTFEVDDKKVTVIDNKITSITVIDSKQKEIEALKVEMAEMKAQLIKAVKAPEPTGDNTDELTALKAEMLEMKGILATAKLTVSNPPIPAGEFHEADPSIELTAQERLAIAQSEAYEASVKKREES